MSSSLITIDQADLGYRGVPPVLRNVSLRIESGDFVALIGENGSGKTTLMRTMLGLLPPLSGRISYSDAFYKPSPGYVPQHSTLDPMFPLTVFEVVIMGLYTEMQRLSSCNSANKERARQSLVNVGLEAYSNKLFSQLSGGQKQRVLVARALVKSPRILFLDEPTAGVDSRAEAEIMHIIAELNRQQQLTVILVSHHLAYVGSRFATSILVRDGQATKGTTSNLLPILNQHQIATEKLSPVI